VSAAQQGLRPSPNIWRVISRNRLTTIGLAILAVLFVVALFPSVLAPYEPGRIDLSVRLVPPSRAHWFGTDDFGRDIYSRVLYGARISLFMSVAIVFVGLVVGATLGVVAGYLGGWSDEVLMRFTDVVFAFPPILLAMVIVTTLQPSLVNLGLTLVLIGWPEYARVMRSQTLAILRREYITAAESIGAPPSRVILRHILTEHPGHACHPGIPQPGRDHPVVGGAGFLGLGAQPPMPEWGLMISEGRNYFLDAWWFPVFPGFAIALATLAFSFVGDGLRDILDPRSRQFVTARPRGDLTKHAAR